MNFPASFNYLDIGLLLVLALTSLNGLYRGMIYELGSLAAFFAGVLVAGKFHGEASAFLAKYIENQLVLDMAAYAGLFLATSIATGLVVRLLRRGAQLAMLGKLDHLLGLFAGFAKGALICILCLVAINYIFPGNTLVANSSLTPYFDAVMEQLALWPETLRNTLPW